MSDDEDFSEISSVPEEEDSEDEGEEAATVAVAKQPICFVGPRGAPPCISEGYRIMKEGRLKKDFLSKYDEANLIGQVAELIESGLAVGRRLGPTLFEINIKGKIEIITLDTEYEMFPVLQIAQCIVERKLFTSVIDIWLQVPRYGGSIDVYHLDDI